MGLRDIRRLARYNLTTLLTSPLSEISGSLGDLGTLLPLMLTLALQHSISLPSTLFFSGLFNILTGLVFGIPLPVQPMKAIAAAAIASHASQQVTVAAGALVGCVVGVLSVTGLLGWLTRRVIPVPVVKGIQFGAGLQLVVSGGGRMLLGLKWVDQGGKWWDNRLWALAAFVGLLFTPGTSGGGTKGKDGQRGRRRTRTILFPYALVVFALGLLLAGLSTLVPGRNGNQVVHTWAAAAAATQDAFVVTSGERDGYHPHIGTDAADGNNGLFQIWRPRFAVPAFGDGSAWAMAIGQLPLTTLNSVIAAAALASELMADSDFPSGGSSSATGGGPGISTPSVTELGLSVALMNLVGCWFGAMPVCHGAGGLAAQYRFGARSGASIVVLGGLKLLLGLFLAGGGRNGNPKGGEGTTLLGFLERFPKAFLGIMVIAAGLELAKVGQSLNHGAADLWEESVDTTTTTTAEEGEGGREGEGEDGDGERIGDKQRKQRVLSEDERMERWTIMLMTAAGILAFKNDAVGFLAGMATWGAYALGRAFERWSERRHGGGNGGGDGGDDEEEGGAEREPLLEGSA